MNSIELNPNYNYITTTNDTRNKNKEGQLELELPVLEDKIIFGNKKFDNIREAVEYIVKQSYPYAFNIKIQNYINITPTKMHVITTFNYQEPTLVTKTIRFAYTYINDTPAYKFDNNYFSDRQEAVKYVISTFYGNYKDLKIIDFSLSNYYRIAEITVEFLDIPDIE